MNRDEALQRAAAGLPIETTRELVFALGEVRNRVPEGLPHWYVLNGFIRTAMKLADREEGNDIPF